jgi:very-short-patch-repair endonuclease
MESHPKILIKKRAKAFRRALTPPEAMLWSRLKTRGTDKPIFRRQFPYETMVFDFYCPAARLAVEIDGSSHWSEEKQAKDEARDGWLKSRGIEVLRVGAGEIYRDLAEVADGVILRAMELISRG